MLALIGARHIVHGSRIRVNNRRRIIYILRPVTVIQFYQFTTKCYILTTRGPNSRAPLLARVFLHLSRAFCISDMKHVNECHPNYKTGSNTKSYSHIECLAHGTPNFRASFFLVTLTKKKCYINRCPIAKRETATSTLSYVHRSTWKVYNAYISFIALYK